MITGNPQHIQESHIVALAYWNDAKRNRLPYSVITVINGLEHTINDVRNGVLLSPDLHQAFDAGEIVIKCERNDDKCKYIVVALNIAYQVYCYGKGHIQKPTYHHILFFWIFTLNHL